ncbi:alpha/beta hydrolase [Ectothiorhodospira lacustris]|uniref:alpha/beta hydrolase n=1 Tax=Ectothiorhodospira lacustris TaxID=2899127 RepID=UPI001EE93B3C|nr:alpha/beta fold hydrolase [Ectothiorhodospira lacustris]MCG5499880.1 alpha/beta fold hydrolase [Ectothiorhodospira lacustris]MCG5509024.1 alpha/beta fold hydrolase [Ectothiorhodospira lacustris]MCG5520815.1 alpha/beta fold hydrolase [Ectothiorhodospira lacustris]
MVLRSWLLRAFRIQARSWVTEPQALGLSPERVRIISRRRKALAASFFLPHPGAPVVVMVHGWGANSSHLLFMVPRVLAEGLNAVVFDARCHGLSDDDGFASLPRFAEDAEAVMEVLRRRGYGDIILLGHSVGAGAVLLAASRTPDLRAVISLSAFSHPEPMMNGWLAEQGIPRRPWGVVINRGVEWFIGHRFDDIAPRTTVDRIQAPLLLVHGEDDDVVPLHHLQILAGANPRATVLTLPGVGHNDPEGFARHAGQIMDWLRPYLPSRSHLKDAHPRATGTV